MANRIRRKPSLKRSAPLIRLGKFGYFNKKNLKNRYHKTISFIEKRPFVSFFITLGILLFVILLGSTLFRTTAPEVKNRTLPKSVEVFRLGESAKINVQGEVKKSGVIKIVAQSPGIVSKINFMEGAQVAKGKVIIALSSNYQGGNAASLQRQLAGLSYQNTKDTYDIQKNLITRQRDLAEKQSENSEALRDITQISINDTRDLINLNSDILNSVKSNIQSLEQSNGDPSQILSLKQVQSQLQAGTNQLLSSLRANEYQVDQNGNIVGLENITKDIALAQLALQEKGLEMSLKAAGISLKLAKVQEATMYPASPFDGTIQKIHVKVGDSVNPGDILVTFSGGSNNVIVDAQVSKDVAEKVSRISPSTISVNDKNLQLIPSYISTEATKGQLYSVLFSIDKADENLFTDDSFVPVTLPLGHEVGTSTPFVPVDGVFQTQDETFVFVVDRGKAKSQKVKLGSVTGGYVVILEGLKSTDQIILNRTVIEGDEITIKN